MSNPIVQFQATVYGRVQGVSFRYYTTLRANQLGCVGWVRNNPDGTVSCLAQGTREKLDELAAFLHEGPAAAVVERVELTWEAPTTRYPTFRTAYAAE